MLQTDAPATGMFLSPAPEPLGDTAALSSAAARYAAAQGELERDRAVLASVQGQTAVPLQWTGFGALAFGDATAGLAGAYALAAAAYAQATAALRIYAADLATAKETTRQANVAISESNSLATALNNAQTTAAQNQATAETTAQAATTAEAQATANPHSPPARLAADQARTTANDAQTAATNAWITVTNLAGQYDTAHTRAVTLTTEAHTQSTTAATKATAAFDAVTGYVSGQNTHPPRGGATGKPGHHSSNFFDSAIHFVENGGAVVGDAVKSIVEHPIGAIQTLGGIGITTLSVLGGVVTSPLDATGLGEGLDVVFADTGATGVDITNSGITSLAGDATTASAAQGAGTSVTAAQDGGIDAEQLGRTATVAQHAEEMTNAGELSRPYINSPMTIQSIMEAGDPVPDPGGVPGGLRWDVPGKFRGSTGTWELVIDQPNNTIVHFLFRGMP